MNYLVSNYQLIIDNTAAANMKYHVQDHLGQCDGYTIKIKTKIESDVINTEDKKRSMERKEVWARRST